MKLQKPVTELIAILRREVQSFNTVVELLILEEKGLIECNNQLLVQVIDRQEDVFSSIACLEKSRMDCIRKIAELVDRDPDTLTITGIAAFSGEPEHRELLETAHVLNEINRDIQRKKKTNAMLIRQGILLVEQNIRIILKAFGRPEAVSDRYTRTAAVEGLRGGIHIDGKL